MKKSPIDYEVAEDVFQRDYTMTRQLHRNVVRWPRKEAIIDPQRSKRLTFEQWDEESNRFANALIAAGVMKYDVVMGNLANTYEWFIASMGSMKVGAIFASLSIRLPEGQVATLVEESEPKILLYDSELQDVSIKALIRAKKKPQVCVMVGEGDLSKETVSYGDFLRGKSAEAPTSEQDVRRIDPALRLYTSGTTGIPKGMTYNHGILFFSCMANCEMSQMNENCTMLTAMPLFHSFGSRNLSNSILHVGGRLVLMKNFMPDTALDYIEKYEATHMGGVPAMLNAMCEVQEAKPRNVGSLKLVIAGGSPISGKESLRYMRTLANSIVTGYGTADGDSVTAVMPWEFPDKAGTIGRSCAESEVVLVRLFPDRKGNPESTEDVLPRDNETEGEIAYRNIQSPYGYLNRPRDTEKAFPYRGWQLTGDVAVWDEEGYITIKGRADDMFISGGENIHPTIVEDALNSHTKVRECMVVGVSNERWGQVCTAYVVPSDSSLTVNELDRFCKDHPMLAAYQRPRFYKFVSFEELPFSAARKKLHRELKRVAEEDSAAGSLSSP